MQQRRRLPRKVRDIKSTQTQCSTTFVWLTHLCCVGPEVAFEGKSLMDQLRGEALKFHKPGKEVNMNNCSFKNSVFLRHLLMLQLYNFVY